MSKRSQQIDAFFRQGQQLHVAGRLAEAEAVYRQVIAAMPRHADALHALGALALQAGQAAVADGLVGQAIAIKPAADFWLTRAHVLLALGRAAEAEAAARHVLRARPASAAAQQVLGHALLDGRRAEGAIEAYRAALRLSPALPDIRNNLGMALRLAGRLEEAEAELRQAPAEPEALANLSSVQKERGSFVEAEATLRQALRLAPGNPVLRYNWSLLMLLLGRTAEAWDGWEERFRAGAIPGRVFAQPEWRGEALGRRRLLVHTEQGLGDVIQFVRYLPAVKGDVVFEAPPRLIRLLSSNPALPPMVPAGSALPAVDLVVPLLSLPARTCPEGVVAVGADGASCPAPSWHGLSGRATAPVGAGARPDEPGHDGSDSMFRLLGLRPPYLFAEAARVAAWRERIGAGGVRVGINWQGFSGRVEDSGRSFPLALFRALAAVPGVRLISLQKGEGTEQIASAGFAVETLEGLDDGQDAFLDTAAVMEGLDLIVTSDTSVAHLAGALGRPVWVALRHVPDWRWMLGRADSPWYPTMRLFRQATPGDWAGVFAEMAGALGR